MADRIETGSRQTLSLAEAAVVLGMGGARRTA